MAASTAGVLPHDASRCTADNCNESVIASELSSAMDPARPIDLHLQFSNQEEPRQPGGQLSKPTGSSVPTRQKRLSMFMRSVSIQWQVISNSGPALKMLCTCCNMMSIVCIFSVWVRFVHWACIHLAQSFCQSPFICASSPLQGVSTLPRLA